MNPKKTYKRGYPVALLLGFGEHSVALWSVFSKVIKPLSIIQLEGNSTDPKALYNLHERIIEILRPNFKAGVRSVILVSPPRSNYSKNFKEHLQKHHSWLTYGASKAAFAELTGNGVTKSEVTLLARNLAFTKIIEEATEEENKNLLELLESRLNALGPKERVLYSPQETEDLIYGPKGSTEPEYLMLTDKYLATYHPKGRINKLLQIAANKKIKTRIVKADSSAGKRLTQLGGFVCLIRIT